VINNVRVFEEGLIRLKWYTQRTLLVKLNKGTVKPPACAHLPR
jgi:hypothetical protein